MPLISLLLKLSALGLMLVVFRQLKWCISCGLPLIMNNPLVNITDTFQFRIVAAVELFLGAMFVECLFNDSPTNSFGIMKNGNMFT